MSSEPKSLNKKPRESCHPFIGDKSRCFVVSGESFFSSGIHHIFQNWPAEFASSHNCSNQLGHTKIIEQNGTFESISRELLLRNVLLHVMQRRRAALHRLQWRRENICRLRRQVYSNNRQCSLHFRSDRGRIAFIPQTSCAIVHLWAGQDHLSKEARLFWSASRVDCFVHTSPKDPH